MHFYSAMESVRVGDSFGPSCNPTYTSNLLAFFTLYRPSMGLYINLLTCMLYSDESLVESYYKNTELLAAIRLMDFFQATLLGPDM